MLNISQNTKNGRGITQRPSQSKVYEDQAKIEKNIKPNSKT